MKWRENSGRSVLFIFCSAWIVPQCLVGPKRTSCPAVNVVVGARAFSREEEQSLVGTQICTELSGVSVNRSDLGLCRAFKNQPRIKTCQLCCQSEKSREFRKLFLRLTQRDRTVWTSADPRQIPALLQHRTALLVGFTGRVTLSTLLAFSN